MIREDNIAEWTPHLEMAAQRMQLQRVHATDPSNNFPDLSGEEILYRQHVLQRLP